MLYVLVLVLEYATYQSTLETQMKVSRSLFICQRRLRRTKCAAVIYGARMIERL